MAINPNYECAKHSRVLIGSGEPSEAAELSTLLSTWGHSADIVSTCAAAALALDRPDPPSILLLDAELPRGGGIALVHELRRRPRQKSIWTIVITGSATAQHVLTARDAGVDDLLAKPIDEFELRVRLHTAIRVQTLYAELNQSLESARFHASHDRLTGLWNRESLLTMLFRETDRVQRMKTPLAFILLDLDGFSELNLEHGYAAGDKVLRQLAARFRRFLRSYDLIGRCGEDEFLIGMPGCSPQDAQLMAERLRTSVLQRTFDLDGTQVGVSASFGVSQSKGRSPLVVLREAERALAAAKRAGRDCVRAFHPDRPLPAIPALEQTPGQQAMPADPA